MRFYQLHVAADPNLKMIGIPKFLKSLTILQGLDDGE
jgi:hypothetical protein